MPKYENGLIYKLIHNDDHENTNIYIGSTTNFRMRKFGHKCNCNNENNECYNRKVYQFIRDNGGWNEWIMIQIEAFPCNNEQELKSRERYYIELMKANLNCYIPNRTPKEYREEHKEKRAEKCKEWYETNKKLVLEKRKEYVNANKENRRKYDLENKEKIATKKKEWRLKNIEQVSIKEKENDNNKKTIVVCNICNCEITKGCLKRHQKTAKCQKAQQ